MTTSTSDFTLEAIHFHQFIINQLIIHVLIVLSPLSNFPDSLSTRFAFVSKPELVKGKMFGFFFGELLIFYDKL